MALTNDLAVLWLKACQANHDTSRHAAGYYGTDDESHTTVDDLNLCQKDALAGNERAQRYMAKFVELRMKS